MAVYLPKLLAMRVASKRTNSTQSKILATKEDLANAKVDLIKWNFGFFVALMLMIVGLYFRN